jgi:hypothetical protein
MLELGISQAQTQFTKLLSQSVTIIDKKSKSKKAVILPYKQYELLLAKANIKEDFQEGVFSQFVGILDDDFKTDDLKYNEIIK